MLKYRYFTKEFFTYSNHYIHDTQFRIGMRHIHWASLFEDEESKNIEKLKLSVSI